MSTCFKIVLKRFKDVFSQAKENRLFVLDEATSLFASRKQFVF